MKFAHLADCHLGSWKHPGLQKLNAEAFNFAIDRCIADKVNFVLIAGDLFDTAIPSIDVLKEATAKLKELKDSGIECYLVPGSHDFSVSGKSMIHVLEKAGLCHDVSIPIETDEYYIAGLGGEKKGLEVKKISSIKGMKKDNKLRILVLHTTLQEMNMPFMNSISIRELPSGFDYYALGHMHNKKVFEKDGSKAVYPGELFPCNFLELEKHKQGYFFIVDFNKGNIDLKEIPVKIKEAISFEIDAENETPGSLKEKILEKSKEGIKHKIVTLRISGKLDSGKPSELDFKAIEQGFMNKGAYCVLRNTSKLLSREFELEEKELRELKAELMDISSVEKEIINNMIKSKVLEEKNKDKVLELMQCLDTEKIEGETQDTFSNRIADEVIEKLNLDFLKNKNVD